jgi:hypothetical protein
MIHRENLTNHRGRNAALVLAGLILLLLPSIARADLSSFDVKPPTASGPIPSTSKNHAFLQDGFGPAAPVPSGYREQEYFVSGNASIYEYTPTGVRTVAPCPARVAGTVRTACTGLPYTTRLIVMRPSDPRRFSGTVVVEPLNPTLKFDNAAIWGLSSNYLTRSSDVFIGWTSKSVTVDALKKWNPSRYHRLYWPYRPFAAGGNDAPYDGITFDVASQIGALVKRGGTQGPLHGYHVKNVIEAGSSQDARFTFTQASAFSRLARLDNGKRIYDGYLVAASPPDPLGLNFASINFGLTPAGSLTSSDPRQKMGPHDGPVIQVNTQTELTAGVFGTAGVRWRRGDSDAPGDRYRAWEVAGSSHDSIADVSGNPAYTEVFGAPAVLGVRRQDILDIASGVIGADGSLQAHLNPAQIKCDRLDLNPFPFSFVQNAAIQALIDWIANDKPAPRAARLDVRHVTTHPQPVLDKYGNAVGGVRTPYLDVPNRTYVASGTSAFCRTEGHSNPFGRGRLRSLYGTTAGYLRKFTTSAALAVRRGFWLAQDARFAVRQARRLRIP